MVGPVLGRKTTEDSAQRRSVLHKSPRQKTMLHGLLEECWKMWRLCDRNYKNTKAGDGVGRVEERMCRWRVG